MLFDKVCNITERILSKKIKIISDITNSDVTNFDFNSFKEGLKCSRLFYMDWDVASSEWNTLPTKDRNDMCQNTYLGNLPYEDGVCFIDTSRVGFEQIVLMWRLSSHQNLDKILLYNHNPDMPPLEEAYSFNVAISDINSNQIMLLGGCYFKLWDEKLNDLQLATTMGETIVTDLDHQLAREMHFSNMDSDMQNKTRSMYQSSTELATMCVHYINHPKKFILEERLNKKEKETKKIKRSHMRPKYTLLSPTDIRKRMSIVCETGRTVSGHDRRGCWREYKNERYVNMKGKKQWINSTWVGPQESSVGNKMYKVLIDK